MDTKEELIELLKNYFKTVKEIEVLKKKIKEKNTYKKELTDIINIVFDKNELDNVNTAEGSVTKKKIKRKENLTKKKMLELLYTYYKDDPTEASNINKYINDNRSTIEQSIITHKLK